MYDHVDRLRRERAVPSLHEKTAGEVRELCATFPAPGILVDKELRSY